MLSSLWLLAGFQVRVSIEAIAYTDYCRPWAIFHLVVLSVHNRLLATRRMVPSKFGESRPAIDVLGPMSDLEYQPKTVTCCGRMNTSQAGAKEELRERTKTLPGIAIRISVYAPVTGS